MNMRLIPVPSIPPRGSVKAPTGDPEPRFVTVDGRAKRQRNDGYVTLLRQFMYGSAQHCEVGCGGWHPTTVYRGLVSACGYDDTIRGVDIIQRGARVFLTRGDKAVRGSRRDDARAALESFAYSGVARCAVPCPDGEAVGSVYALFQRQRTLIGLGYVRVEKGTDGIVLVNTMVGG